LFLYAEEMKQQRVKKRTPEQKKQQLIEALENYRDEIYNSMLDDVSNSHKYLDELRNADIKLYNERKKLGFMLEGLPENGFSDCNDYIIADNDEI
jgi:hypothetical protein